MHVKTGLRYLEDRWDEQVARTLDQPELLSYRPSLLRSDLRITNFGGGNTIPVDCGLTEAFLR